MTLSVTTDHALIRKTIYDWLLAYSGVSEVDYVNQMVGRLPKPYGSILILSTGLKIGIDEKREVFDIPDQVIQRRTTGPRTIIVQCEIYTDPLNSNAAAGPVETIEAAERLENALLSLESSEVQDALRLAKIGLLSHTNITRLDEQSGDRWERRAVADVSFSYSGETFDDGLTGESGNWVESVEIPTEVNGNATYNQ